MAIRKGGAATVVAACVLLSSGAAVAATPTPGSVNPSRAGERVAPQQELPSVGAPIEIPSSPEQTAPAGAEAHKFTLTAVSFDGNTKLSSEQLSAIAAPYIGKEISLAQVYELASKVTAAYRAEGYILARAIVPTQTIEDGVLHIKIVEGFIDKVTIEGDAGGAKRLLEEHGRRIAAIHPLTAKVLERELLLAQDISGLDLRSVLTPSKTTPGAADLTLLVKTDPFSGYVGADNLGSKYLGPYEVTGAVFGNDILGLAGQLGVTAVVTPGRLEMGYGALTYDVPLTASGLRSYTLLSYTRTEPGYTLSSLETRGKALTFQTQLSYPVVRSRDFNLVAGGVFTSRDSKSEDSLVKPLYNDHIRSLGLKVQGNALDTMGGYSTFQATFTRGLHIFGATTSSDLNKSRSNADGEFNRLNIDVSHIQPVIPDVSVLVGAAAQTSFGRSLLSSEQFGLGGTYYGRGYDSSELTGDRGLAGKAELRWDAIGNVGFVKNVQFYGFYEGGTVWLEHPLPGEQERASLTSTGLGARVSAFNSAQLSLEVAKPLTRDVATEGNRDPRLFFTIGTSF